MTTLTADRIEDWLLERVIKPTAMAIAWVIVALLWTFPLQHVIAYPFVFLFFGAIMGSVWFGGMIAGGIAVVFSSLLIGYFFIPPLYSMTIAKESQSFFTAFILCAIAITIVGSAKKRAEDAIRDARDQLEEKVHERTADLERSNLEIKESERQLRQLTEAIPQQIWRTAADGKVEYCNRPLIEYLGKAAAASQRDAFWDILHAEDQALFRQEWREAVESQSRFETEVRIRGAVGSYRWFLVRAVPQFTAEGAVARWYGIHIDIEEQRRVQERLARAHEEYGRVSHLLSMAEMAASIAHELNQPLTAVVTHAYACREWLRPDAPNLEKASTTAEKIVQESTRASAVVSRVRALFRKEPRALESTDLNELIRGVARLLREEAIRRQISIRLEQGPDLPAMHLDAVQIQQVLLNLAMNGLEAMEGREAGKELVIRSRGVDGEAMISVEDRGPGVSKEMAERIFEPFFTTKSTGAGMGLSICRSIVEVHDGRLWMENLPAGGAAFRFNLRSQP